MSSSDRSRLHRFSGLEDSIGYMARIIFRRFSASVERRTSPFGITTGQLAVLRALWIADGVAQHQLSESLELCEATVAISLRRLEAIGVVRRQTNSLNRRETLVFLTDLGQTLEAAIGWVPRAVNTLALGNFTPAEADTLHDLLLVVHRNLAENEQPISRPIAKRVRRKRKPAPLFASGELHDIRDPSHGVAAP
ncbi:MAG: MarR family winged helix-turn-helix transcriptional regulator [Steroidobacteraceae bacterium]|uniref:MarR family winged helix-turn-helix transcriptional regulator n=1 Tax=Sphingopyxis sp. TaxID=1908224 RepID=UPI003D6D3C11